MKIFEIVSLIIIILGFGHSFFELMKSPWVGNPVIGVFVATSGFFVWIIGETIIQSSSRSLTE